MKWFHASAVYQNLYELKLTEWNIFLQLFNAFIMIIDSPRNVLANAGRKNWKCRSISFYSRLYILKSTIGQSAVPQIHNFSPVYQPAAIQFFRCSFNLFFEFITLFSVRKAWPSVHKTGMTLHFLIVVRANVKGLLSNRTTDKL